MRACGEGIEAAVAAVKSKLSVIRSMDGLWDKIQKH